MARIAFFGTGLLGSGMVEAMLKHGESVTVWNRTASKTNALAALGARIAPDPEAAVNDADRVHMALADDAVVDGLLRRIAPQLGQDTIVVDHTTTAPVTTGARVERMNRDRHSFLHAPVFMSPQMCRDAMGLMLVSGPGAVFERARPALQAMTGEVWYVGERPDLAAAYKIFGNSLMFAIAGGLADVMSMAANLGVPPQDAAGLFTRFKPGNIIAARAEKMAKGDFSATFELTMARKDMRLMLEAAGGVPLTVLPSVAKRMDEAIAGGHAHDDTSALAAAALAVSASSRRARR
jgi:3-hydroxyisobutyrate dehydrogenase